MHATHVSVLAANASVGRTDGTMEIRDGRAKGFCTGLHHAVREIEEYLARKAQECEGSPDVHRFFVRIPVAKGVKPKSLRRIRVPWKGTEIHLEGLMPAFPGVNDRLGWIASFGANTKVRTTSPGIRAEEQELRREAVRERPKKRSAPPDGFLVELMERSNPAPQDVLDLREIYESSFGAYLVPFTEEIVAGMIQSNRTAVVRQGKGGKIVAVSQAEMVDLEFEGELWTLIELSETACHRDFRGKGLSQLCNDLLIRTLAGPRTLIYTDAAANNFAVMRSSWNSGMRPFGWYDQHCRMVTLTRDTSEQQTVFSSISPFVLPQKR